MPGLQMTDGDNLVALNPHVSLKAACSSSVNDLPADNECRWLERESEERYQS
jgi:hypothetical protein